MTLRFIDLAIESVERERRSIRNECEAFDQWRERIRPMSIASRTVQADPATPAAVLESYRDTVMSTADFEGVYDESLEEHFAEELGEHVADRLRTADELSGRLKRKLLSAGVQAHERRECFLRTLDAEEASLKAARCKLLAIRNRFDEIPPCSILRQPLDHVIDGWRTLDQLEAKCEGIAAERQRFILEDRQTEQLEEPFVLNEYLYDELETTHPILSAVATMSIEIRWKRTAGSDIDRETDITA